MQRAPLAAAFLSSLCLTFLVVITLISRPRAQVDLSSAGAWPRVGEVLHNVRVEHPRRSRAHRIRKGEPLVTAKSEEEAREELKGTSIPAATQQLRYTGSYADTSYVVNAPAGDPATVYAHHSIWPAKVDPKMPYIETVHADGTPYMQPLTVYAPPGGAVLPEADNAPLDNTVYQCQPSGYMIGPVGYHCTPACKDSALWRSDYGDCSVYRSAIKPGGFKDYCGSDKDIAGVPATVACPVSCGTCGIGLCYVKEKFKACKLSTYSTEESEETVA
ncbi:hypothetical protein GUITHDRAFT_161834 [Guillardia theta CCMP2712]|uniref:ShKT domain-containing protein n=1 Tax=Guillardia theta (strain CCMP2712) TaxID=905079 RepID=L1JQN2_GUITC|nr:hypothetical protein GUITHDRAFT_161834 [Guillardia theta CCMP2712]EKX50599.1 hypothetical protein GUITHDRAFT_161834 [Guillardia theta CCMP2712]|eukprot:XP_005837579.1 hypothetical protein GUITHDRAFT_161834 [Guillardia theta CCMP2712]